MFLQIPRKLKATHPRKGIYLNQQSTQRVTVQYVAEKTVLRAEELDVHARLAKSRYELSVAENGLATQREALNQLLCPIIAIHEAGDKA